MLSKDFPLLYKEFLRIKVDKYYLGQFSDVKVLGEYFLNDSYFVIFEGHKNGKFEIGIIIENISKPIFATLKVQPSADDYITINKNDLFKVIPKKLYMSLAKQGLATTVKIGLKRNKRFSWHRLICCGYYNCLGREVHHIDKNPKNNGIINLVPISRDFHMRLDKNVGEAYIYSRLLQNLELNKKKNKNTLAKNVLVILDVLRMKSEGRKTCDIVKSLSAKIKKSTVYNILKKYYYAEEFLKWLNSQEQQCFTDLDGNFCKRWDGILKFDSMSRPYRKVFM